MYEIKLVGGEKLSFELDIENRYAKIPTKNKGLHAKMKEVLNNGYLLSMSGYEEKGTIVDGFKKIPLSKITPIQWADTLIDFGVVNVTLVD